LPAPQGRPFEIRFLQAARHGFRYFEKYTGEAQLLKVFTSFFATITVRILRVLAVFASIKNPILTI
jgi:hypothetical protein